MNRISLPIAAIFLMMMSGSVVAQETASADDIRAILTDLRDGTLDDLEADPRLVDAIGKSKRKTKKRLKSLGQVQDITFWNTYKGWDLFLVSFESGRAVYWIMRSDTGKILGLHYRIVMSDG